MSNIEKISLVTLIGSLCVSADDGQRVHDLIAKKIRSGIPTIVSFSGVDTLISAFLNASIGQLYGEFDEAIIDKYVQVVDMEPEDHTLLLRVIQNAKVYFANKIAFDDAWKKEQEND